MYDGAKIHQKVDKNEQTVQSQGCTNAETLNNATKEMLRRFFK